MVCEERRGRRETFLAYMERGGKYVALDKG